MQTDDSKNEKGVRAGVFGQKPRVNHDFSSRVGSKRFEIFYPLIRL